MAKPMTRDVDTCPDLETIAAFLDGRLAGPDRDAMASHLATCETCYFIFSEAVQTSPTQGNRANDLPPASAWWTRRRVLWAATAAMAAAASVLLALSLGVLPWRASEEPALQSLVAAVGTDRLIEPRITGGFGYGPVRAVRSSQSPSFALSPDVRIAAARIEKETTGGESASALHARGVASMVTGDIDRAVTTLQQAAARQPDGRILSDLAAAYLARAARTNDKDDLSRALAVVNRALEVDRLLPEARFNRAVALEHLSMTEEARAAWQAYLTIDDRSGWADEARARLRALNGHP